MLTNSKKKFINYQVTTVTKELFKIYNREKRIRKSTLNKTNNNKENDI